MVRGYVMRKVNSGFLGAIAGIAIFSLLLQACTYGPMRAPTQAGLVLYTQGARQHTATVQLQVPPPEVYDAMLRIIRNRSDLRLISNNDKHYLVEVMRADDNVTLQATPLDSDWTLLFVWATAGKNNGTGRDLALRAVKQVCSELGVSCKMQDL